MRGRLTAAMVAVALLGPVAGSVGPALAATRTAFPVALAGTTRIVAPDHPARMVVQVPRPVRFGGQGYLDLPYIRVDGTASAVAVYLIPVHTRLRSEEVTMFGRLPSSLGQHTIASFPGGNESVAPGDYDLLVVHSAGTATVTINFPGLKARSTLAPRRRSAATIALLKVPPLLDDRLAPAGSSEIINGKLASTGFIDVNVGVEVRPGAVTQLSMCMYPGGGDLPSVANTAPGCSDGDGAQFLTAQGDLAYSGTDFLNWARGTYGASIDYRTTNLPTGVAGWAAWVPYNG